MNYISIEEFVAYVRESEAVNQSNELDSPIVNLQFWEKAIETASVELDSRLGARFKLPLPASAHVKSLCYPIAHWWAEKYGEKRDYVQKEYEATIELLKDIAKGTALLIGIDGSPVPVIPLDQTPTIAGVDYGLEPEPSMIQHWR